MCYKIVFKIVDVDISDFFCISSNLHFTRGNHYKLMSRSIPHHNFRLNFFSEHAIPIWNSLPNSVVSASSISTFKAHLSHVDLTPFCKLFAYNRQFISAFICHYLPFRCSFHLINYIYYYIFYVFDLGTPADDWSITGKQ